jgi:hypothetical protein
MTTARRCAGGVHVFEVLALRLADPYPPLYLTCQCGDWTLPGIKQVLGGKS